MLGLELFGVTGLAVGHIHVAGFGVVDDVCFHYGDLCHALFPVLDFFGQVMIAGGGIRHLRFEISVVQQTMFREIVHGLSHLLQIENAGQMQKLREEIAAMEDTPTEEDVLLEKLERLDIKID